MKHHKAIEYLPDLGSGALDAGTEEALASHAEDCPACRDWISTRDLLVDGLSAGVEPGGDHPPSELLALCVLRPEEVHESDREELRAHLDRCPLCREDVTLLRAAVREARPGDRRAPSAPHQGRPVLRGARRWLAAAGVLLFLGAGLVVGGFLFARYAPDVGALDEDPRAASRSTPVVESIEELSGRDLDGAQVIEGRGALVVSKVTVKSGADVTLRAGGVVAFGDGFQVAEGARLRVGASPTADPKSGNGNTNPGRDRPRG